MTMLELVMHIYKKLAENPAMINDIEGEKQHLIEEGHPKKEVDRAFDLAVEKFSDPEKGTNIRYLHADESRFFTNEAYGLLMNLQMTGILQPRIVELILTRAIVLQSGRIDADEVTQLVNFILMNPENQGHKLAFDLITFQNPEGDIN
ncbi:MAG: DUF494 family protein [Candidatus Zixiibacteriota bacterium]